MSTSINGGEKKTVYVGGNVNRVGRIVLDVLSDGEWATTDVPIVELLDALNKINGVEASYAPPFKAEEQPVGTIVRAYGQSDDNGYIKVEGGWRWIGKLDQKRIGDDEMNRYLAKVVGL